MNIKEWDNNLLNNFFDDTLVQLTDEQVKQVYFHVGVVLEERKRKAEKFLTEHQGDNQGASAYGDSEDERGFED